MSSPGPETWRLFFALWPDPQRQQTYHRLARRLLAETGGRPVAAPDLHLTLAFIGAADAAVRHCLEDVADTVALAPFELTLDRAGYWPRPRVAWLGTTQTPEPLRELARRLNEGMAVCGLQPERRPFAAHLTVARKARCAPAGEAIAPQAWPVADFVLAESLTLPQGGRYRVLRRWPLRRQL